MRYVIGFLVTLGLIALLIILLISGGGRKTGTTHVSQKNLTDYASTDAQTVLTIDGPINAESEHDQVRITVDNTDVTYEHIRGYQGNAVQTKIFANNEDAYNAFLHALLHAGFTVGDNNPALRDPSGWCATGARYIFSLTQDGKTIQQYWNTSCDKTKTYEGNTPLTLTLFEAQVPGFNDLIQNLNL